MAQAEASRCLSCPDPTCVRGCPVHNDIPHFIAAIRDRDLDAAHSVIRKTSFLPDICSRVCDQAVQCEGACTWSLAGGTPVSIGALERFITENAAVPPVEQVSTRGRGLDIAIVGSGPAGISAAWELAQAGATVTVFEKDAKPGGLLRWGIPEFTLPDVIATRPWNALVEAGVTLNCNAPITKDNVDALLNDHDAVLFAHGAGSPLRLPVPGGDLEGVWDATRFLNDAFDAVTGKHQLPYLEGRESGKQPTVLVVGAGNTAMDVARLARRLGARAICVDWMDRRFAPVRPDELDEAAEEGVEIRFSTTLDHLEGKEGQVSLAHFNTTRQDRASALPKVVVRNAVTEQVDLVVMAMGYRMDSSISPLLPAKPLPKSVKGIPDRCWEGSGIIAAGKPSYARDQQIGMVALGRESVRVQAALGVAERVWVAGDALIGPATVVEAMAQGREAARAILDLRPTRNGWQLRSSSHVLVAYESEGGYTEHIAREISDQVRSKVESVICLPLHEVGVAELTSADLVFLGTWVEGLAVTNVRAAAPMRKWLDALPAQLGEKRFALFCTYGFSPRGSLAAMQDTLQSHHAMVLGSASFKHGSKDTGAIKAFLATAVGLK